MFLAMRYTIPDGDGNPEQRWSVTMQGPEHDIMPGDRALDFVLPGPNGKFYQFYERTRGKPSLLIFCPSVKSKAWPEVETFAKRHADFDSLGLDIFAVTFDATEQVATLDMPFLVWTDPKKKITEYYLNAAGIPAGAKNLSTVFLLDANQRVLSIMSGLETEQARRAYNFYLSQPQPRSPQILSDTAPALLLPKLLDPAMCRSLIKMWKHGDQEEGKVSSVVDDEEISRVYLEVKKRRDHRIMSSDLNKTLQLTIGRRIAPELEKAYNYTGFRFDRFLVVCYDAERGDYLRPHRDNLAPSDKDRVFALTLNLNASEYEGGELVFPEYGAHKYKPEDGGGILFSCSLMHEALPVTEGRRFALLTFLRKSP